MTTKENNLKKKYRVSRLTELEKRTDRHARRERHRLFRRLGLITDNCFPAISFVARSPIIIIIVVVVVVQTSEPGIFAGEFDFLKTLKETFSGGGSSCRINFK